MRRPAGPSEGGGRVSLVTVSHACAATYAPHCQIDAVIYNGVDVERIPFGAQAADEGYLLYAGRITPEKGVEDALEIADQSGRPLILAGGVYDAVYYDARVAPRLAAMGGRAQYVGQVTRERLWELMAGAVAVLCPSHWAEPFGLVACEAQAAGAPVIAYARGGLAEVIADGVTGFLVAPGDYAAAVAAVRRAPTLDRAACRAHVTSRFSLARMLADYEAHYARMLA
jgi:glycosyltransferase involved in cell wall biosynthesis